MADHVLLPKLEALLIERFGATYKAGVAPFAAAEGAAEQEGGAPVPVAR